jgi:hypothetical protein
LTKNLSYCQVIQLDCAPAASSEATEPSHIHVVRPSRRPITPDTEALPLLSDLAIEDDSAAA